MRIVSISLIAIAGFTAPAAAWEDERLTEVNGRTARLLACFEQVTMPAKVLVTPILVEEAKRQYVKRRDGTIELVEFPARYREEREVLEPSYTELREIPCKKRNGLFGF